jgi:hypothetical protein
MIATTVSTGFLLLLVLACPLMMLFMMRGGHGHGGGHHGHASGGDEHQAPAPSTDELRHRRYELDREIAEREAEEETRRTLSHSR